MIAAPPLGGRFATAAATPIMQSSVSAESRREQVRSKAEAHYERHAKAWIASRYTRLLLREGHQPALRPDGAADDRKAHLMRAATHLVQRNHSMRIARIERAGQRSMNKQNEAGR